MKTTKLLLSILFFVYAGNALALTLTSPVFIQGAVIPKKYTCDGLDMSPPLQWQGAPTTTKSFVLIMDDADAPTGNWDHWIAFNMPATVTELTEGSVNMPEGTLMGVNSWKRNDYNGPCPPMAAHRYMFKLYALDKVLELSDRSDKQKVELAMKGHVLESATLMGTYQRNVK